MASTSLSNTPAADTGGKAAAGPPQAAALDADRPHIETPNRGILFFAIMAAALLQILDTTIANVALPHMQASLGATSDSISWVLTSYIVASAIALPTTGWLSGRIGTRPLLLISVTAFIVFSALCGLSVSLTEIVLFRLGQGVAGAFIMPLSQSVMLDVTRPSQHGTAMMIWAMGIMAGPIAGPILGGYLTENFDWRWVFFVNVPVGVMALALLVIHLPHWDKVKVRFDRVGFVLIAVAIGALQLLLDRGEQVDWFASGKSWLYLALMLSCGWAAVAHLALARDPLFDRSLFRDRNFNVALVIIMVVGLCLFATLALLPPLLQTLLGYSVLETGMVMSPRGIGVLICMPVSQFLVRKGVDTAADRGRRLCRGGHFHVRDGGMVTRRRCAAHRPDGPAAGDRHRPDLPAAQHAGLCHPARQGPCHRVEPAEPVAVDRIVDRHFGGGDAAGAQRADQPHGTGPAGHARGAGQRQSGCAVADRADGPRRDADDRRHDQPAGGDDRLYQRFLAHGRGLFRHPAADHADPAPEEGRRCAARRPGH